MKYFQENEFKMGDKIVFDKMSPDLLYKLDELRELCGFPITITSSYRTEAYNKKIGGAAKSKHLLGIAVDLSCKNSQQRYKIVEEAIKIGFNGIGVAKTFIHLDTRLTDGVIWTY